MLPTLGYTNTLGSSIGINIGGLSLESKERNIIFDKDKDTNMDIGMFYKYNWNINRIIVGAEFFYDFLNLQNDLGNTTIDFRYRYGIDLNLGYNITNNFSIYGMLGYGLIKYRAVNGGIYELDKKEHLKSRLIYGAGIGYELSVSWKVSLEYNMQTLNFSLHDGDSLYKYKNYLDSIKLSLMYKF